MEKQKPRICALDATVGAGRAGMAAIEKAGSAQDADIVILIRGNLDRGISAVLDDLKDYGEAWVAKRPAPNLSLVPSDDPESPAPRKRD